MGQPGSGKSTLATKLLDALPTFDWVSSDSYVGMLGYGTYDENFHSCIKQATKLAKDDRNRLIRDRKSFVWDQTNLNFKYQFPKEYYTIAVIMPIVSWDHVQKCNKLRKGKTISHTTHGVFTLDRLDLQNKLMSGSKLGFDEIIYAKEFKLG